MKRAQKPRRPPQGRSPKKKASGTGEDRRSRRHPLFGEIPLIPVFKVGSGGRTVSHWTYDRSYKPKMPAGAVRGDVTKQEFCEMCHVPRYFYLDQESTCRQCGEAFTFGAAEQKYWYETLKFNFRSVAIRCPSCRRRRRTARALQAQLSDSMAAIRQRPDDPASLMACAEATARLRQRLGTGDLDRAISHSRRAAKLWPEAREPAFWEGLCQALAGRHHKARPLLESFLGRGGKSRRLRPLMDEAEALLSQLDAASP